jgi:hypothetical protein
MMTVYGQVRFNSVTFDKTVAEINVEAVSMFGTVSFFCDPIESKHHFIISKASIKASV